MEIPNDQKDAPEKRKAQTVYLHPAVIRRVKHYAIDAELEISEVVEKALLAFLECEGQKEERYVN